MALKTAFLCTLLLTAGCGFHLRGTLELPPGWDSIAVSGDNPNGELQQNLVSSLQSAGVMVVEDADLTLHVESEEKSRRNVAIDSAASATEFEIELATNISLSDARGEYLLEPTRIAVQRLMNHNPNDVVGEAAEVRTLERELRDDLIQQILRRIRFLASSDANKT
jgi:LPS-assembly lipoprotein